MAKIDTIQHFRTNTAGLKPTAGQLEDGEWAFNLTDGIAFFKDAAGNVREVRPLETKDFTVALAGQTNFSVLALASQVLIFTINGLGYENFVTINPAGSGNIVYDDVSSGYEVEIGDFIRVLYF